MLGCSFKVLLTHVISPEDFTVWPKMMKTYRIHSLGEWRHLVSYQEIDSVLIQFATKAQLSGKKPFSRRMETPGQLPGN